MGRGTSSLPASEKFQRRGNIRDKGLRKRSLFSASYDFDVRGTKEETNGSGKTSYRDRPVGWFLRKSQNLSGIKSKHVSYHASHIHRGARGENARLPSQLVSHENRSATPFSSFPPPSPHSSGPVSVISLSFEDATFISRMHVPPPPGSFLPLRENSKRVNNSFPLFPPLELIFMGYWIFPAELQSINSNVLRSRCRVPRTYRRDKSIFGLLFLFAFYFLLFSFFSGDFFSLSFLFSSRGTELWRLITVVLIQHPLV